MLCVSRALVVAGCLVVAGSAWAQPGEQQASEQQASEQKASEQQNDPERGVEYWAEQLSSNYYLRRETARRKLIQFGDESVEVLEQALVDADLETTELAIRALGEIALNQKADDVSGAWEALERIATRRAGSKANRARLAWEEVNVVRSVKAIEEIRAAGIEIGSDEFSIQSSSKESVVLRINSSWNGDLEALKWLRWARKIQFAHLEGPVMTRDVLELVALMPDLATVMLSDGTLDVEALEALKSFPKIDTLEIRYTHLDEPMADVIMDIPLRASLSLIGTDLPKAKVDAMREKLPGLMIEYKQGGYLGVGGGEANNACVINRVLYGSAAEKAGLQSGDIIVRIDDTPIKTFGDLQDKVSQHYEGDTLTIEYKRHTVPAKTTVVLGKLVE